MALTLYGIAIGHYIALDVGSVYFTLNLICCYSCCFVVVIIINVLYS